MARKKHRLRAPKPRQGVEFSRQVNSWLIRSTYRAVRAGLPLTAEDVETHCWKALSRYVVSDYDAYMGTGSTKATGAALTDTQAEQIIASVTTFVLDHYDPAEFARIQAERGAARRKFQASQLRAYLGMSKAAAAKMLGCSVSTVARLRRKIRASAFGNFLFQIAQSRNERNEKQRASVGPAAPARHAPAEGGAVRPSTDPVREGGVRAPGRDGPGSPGGDRTARTGRPALALA